MSLDTFQKMFLLFVSLSEVGVKADLSNRNNLPVTEEITLFTLTKPMESESVTEKPCKGLYEETSVNLTLTNASVDVFPVCLPKKIEVLDLSSNNLTTIRYQDLSELSQLRILILKHNQIREIRWESQVVTSLEVLDLSYNHLSAVPKCIQLRKVKWLSLVGNPISQIQPFAFTCFPNLASLNLSSTLLGSNTIEDISPSAFALNTEEALESTLLKSLHVLDLSETFLRRVNQAWSEELPHLKELHIMKMTNLENLEADLLKSFPQLELLNCANSRALSFIRTSMFEDASHMKSLDFQNCNLTSLSPWNTSSGYLVINLHGNPLHCSCGLSWLFSEHVNITLLRANETLCGTTYGGGPSFSLLQQHNRCQLNMTRTLTDNEAITEATIGLNSSAPVTSTENPLQYLQETSTDLLKNMSSPREKKRKSFIPETITIFKTVADSKSATLLPEIQLTDSITLKSSTSADQAGQTFTEGITLSSTGYAGSSTAKGSSTIRPVIPFTKYPTMPSTTKFDHTDQMKQKSTKASTGKDRSPYAEIPRDYVLEYDYEDDQQAKTTAKSQSIPCEYHHCKHLQRPCFELQQLAQCFCPGLSGENIIPDPPRLREVSEITDTSAQIHWCAPNSVVEKYQLLYHPEGHENQTVVDNIYITTRQYTLYNLLPHTTYHICAVGLNKAGSSELANDNLSRTPCSTFNTKPSNTIILAVLCTLGGVFLATIIVLSVCLHKTCKNNLFNQYDTHLVSYKNPAFDHQLNIPSFN
ncbi:leucine-rich repeat neuronal protein 4 isoform X2 [Ascaphus truei]